MLDSNFHLFRSFFLILIGSLIFQWGQLDAQKNVSQAEVLKAYEMRIKGDVEGASKLLEKVIAKDSSVAMAYYELSRIKKDDKLILLQKATKLDPENTMYQFDLANAYMLNAYIAMMQGQEDASKEPLGHCVNSLKKILKIKADCKESLLFLIELYTFLDDLGTKEDIENYLAKLKKIDPVYAAHGELIQAGPEENAVEFWQKYMDENGKSPDLLIKKGLACLNQGDTEKAGVIFTEVLQDEPDRKELYLQLARGHLYKAMRADQESAKKEMDFMKKYINIYLEKERDKTNNVEAWCYGWLSMLERRSGNNDQAKVYLDKANQIDPNFSRATALPSVAEYNSPDEIKYQYKSYFTPF